MSGEDAQARLGNAIDDGRAQLAYSEPTGTSDGRGLMSIEVNGIAHIQLTVRNTRECIAFWEALCHFLEMKTLLKNDSMIYCIGSRTGVLVRGLTADSDAPPFDRDGPGWAWEVRRGAPAQWAGGAPRQSQRSTEDFARKREELRPALPPPQRRREEPETHLPHERDEV